MNTKKILKKIFLIFLSLSVFISAPFRVSAESEVISKLEAGNQKRIALTFDDGPHPSYTKKILSVLEEYNVTATFFVIGVNVKNYNDAFMAIIDSGCEIGNHTYHHSSLKESDNDRIRNELVLCNEEIEKYTGDGSVRLLRPPQGAYGDNLRSVADEFGCTIVLWSIDTLDWAGTSAPKIAENVLENVGDGDIILMHDYVSGKSTTVDALRIMIPELLKRGYSFVTVSELMKK